MKAPPIPVVREGAAVVVEDTAADPVGWNPTGFVFDDEVSPNLNPPVDPPVVELAWNGVELKLPKADCEVEVVDET